MQKDRKRIIKTPKIVAVDFDGTLCKDAYPNIGEPLPYSLYYIKKLAAAGNILILHTCRNGELLDAAVAWCKERGITFDYINENAAENINRYGGDTRKIYADIYVDTNAVNPRRVCGIGENDEYAIPYEAAEIIARRDLCDAHCFCPDIRAAGKCYDCDVFFALREYHALQIIENAEAAKGSPAYADKICYVLNGEPSCTYDEAAKKAMIASGKYTDADFDGVLCNWRGEKY